MSDTDVATGKKSKGAGCLRWLGRVTLGVIVLLLGLAVIGAIYQGVASANDEKTYKPVDQMVDVNGIQMRMDCQGSGSPTVVLEAGAGSSSRVWVRTQGEVAKFTRVCSYDRAGYGWSDPVQEEMFPDQVAEMLHTLLEKAGEAPPYLMVGHSFGGIYIRAFAAQYPDEVVGMVLVDSSHENQNQQVPPELVDDFEKLQNAQKTAIKLLQIAEPFGVVRAIKMLDANGDMFPEQEKKSALAEIYHSGYIGANVRESNVSTAYSGQPQKLGDIPLIVLSQKMDAQKFRELYPPEIQSQLSMERWQQEADVYNKNQNELAALSTRGKRIVVEDSGHFIQLDQPQVVIDAIREVFDQVAR